MEDEWVPIPSKNFFTAESLAQENDNLFEEDEFTRMQERLSSSCLTESMLVNDSTDAPSLPSNHSKDVQISNSFVEQSKRGSETSSNVGKGRRQHCASDTSFNRDIREPLLQARRLMMHHPPLGRKFSRVAKAYKDDSLEL